MKKKTYNQPATEVAAFQTERMMQDFNVSINNGGSGDPHPSAGAPARSNPIPD
jgi:hypothetical protein